jgi:aspartate/methionine/tyrosine aminotransferase
VRESESDVPYNHVVLVLDVARCIADTELGKEKTMRNIRNATAIILPWAVALASLGLPGCGSGEAAEEPPQEAAEASSTTSIAMDGNPEVTAAVRDAIAEMKAADPNVDLSVDEQGTVLTGDEQAIAELATSITNQFDDANVAMGKHTYCIHYSGPSCGWDPVHGMPIGWCHQGSYWNAFFANLDALKYAVKCGGGASASSGGCQYGPGCEPG